MKTLPHPELQEGEVFLMNISRRLKSRSIWKTARIGKQAFSLHGDILKGMRPVFVQRSELIAADIDPDKIRSYGPALA